MCPIPPYRVLKGNPLAHGRQTDIHLTHGLQQSTAVFYPVCRHEAVLVSGSKIERGRYLEDERELEADIWSSYSQTRTELEDKGLKF